MAASPIIAHIPHQRSLSAKAMETAARSPGTPAGSHWSTRPIYRRLPRASVSIIFCSDSATERNRVLRYALRRSWALECNTGWFSVTPGGAGTVVTGCNRTGSVINRLRLRKVNELVDFQKDFKGLFRRNLV